MSVNARTQSQSITAAFTAEVIPVGFVKRDTLLRLIRKAVLTRMVLAISSRLNANRPLLSERQSVVGVGLVNGSTSKIDAGVFARQTVSLVTQRHPISASSVDPTIT